MVNCILIADSGSTKTDWILTTAENSILEVETMGINPVRDSRDAIFDVINNHLAPLLPKEYNVDQVFFYGAGCIDPYKKNVIEVLANIFGMDTEVAVESDLLGAARALCGNQAGIAAIIIILAANVQIEKVLSMKQLVLFCFNFGLIPLKFKKGLFIFRVPAIYESV